MGGVAYSAHWDAPRHLRLSCSSPRGWDSLVFSQEPASLASAGRRPRASFGFRVESGGRLGNELDWLASDDIDGTVRVDNELAMTANGGGRD